jgi:2-amino-4-hydroxy-6-hydroxymethyldihydropteridine diphosphokinase
MSGAASIDLPGWARVSDRRRGHIARVTALLDEWARALRLDAEEARAWHDVGLWHDALRDDGEESLRARAGDHDAPVNVLHGPAAAAELAARGETRASVIAAVQWHTLGHPGWDRCGKALYMADYLEPGRPFAPADRAFFASLVPHDFDGVFRQVVRQRIEWSLREGKGLFQETVALWNEVR